MNYLVIRTSDGIQKVFLDEISVLIIESTAVSLTVVLLQELANRGIDTIFCDSTRNPCSELKPFYCAQTTNERILVQINWTINAKTLVWTEIVRQKIKKQQEMVARLHIDDLGYFKAKAESVLLGDKSKMEAQVAKKYFHLLFGNNFSRHTDTPINAALNYGYGILLSVFNREIVKNGYLTELGICHSNVHNTFNLGCDLMEPFRPLVDQIVFYMMPFDEFTTTLKHELLGIFNCKLKINDRHYDFLNATEIYCTSLFQALQSKNINLIKFFEYE
ncbi:MAG: type II CRISPR-associated endonuclease Cas1 [Spirochaetia bacterium]|jgi:CRISPR-associated endonuclease Cas1 subtype II|nr:type II CRISPR-associated endonuclease Cas1 [Spirochaetia bacterium]